MHLMLCVSEYLRIAARDKTKAEAFAKKHGIPKHYGGTAGYQGFFQRLDLSRPLNMLLIPHFFPSSAKNFLASEWTEFRMDSEGLADGKHVLLEKTCTDVAQEMQKLVDIAERRGLVLLEASHYLTDTHRPSFPHCSMTRYTMPGLLIAAASLWSL
ncbi:hypothetical protein BD410DRAFT_131619 [Rickenella mellea]|uniref:Gfo/Idh/MocA-like oxidoreductase N-terminal domain-containing protein n=1 Tax=Rickenella mellea TaxID=50990 RepID=A0A4Y7Q8R9_9AGAM|nr:hypothetical protein BD410DRAFT_131619 [Rickenella mellea]